MSNDTDLEKQPTEDNKEEQVSADNDNIIEGIPEPPVSNEILAKLPPEIRQQVILMMSYQRLGMPSSNPIAAKVTPAHIDKLLDNSEKDSEREHESEKSRRWFHLGYAILSLAFLVFLFVYLPTVDKELLKQVIGALVVFAGGFGSGVGASKYLGKKNKED
jgi:hypothetical protein